MFADCQLGDALLLAGRFFGLFDKSRRKTLIDGCATAATG
jgi:hypothetical protein